MPKHAIASLSQPKIRDGPPYRFDGEANFHHAFKAEMRVAEVLAEADLHHDALANLYLSIECFLKYVYCLVREQEVPANLYASPMTEQLTESLAAKTRFRDHDLRSEEHTSELQSHLNLVCRLLLEKKQT